MSSQQFLGIDLGGCRSKTTAVIEASFSPQFDHTFTCSITQAQMLPASTSHLTCHALLRQCIAECGAEHIGIDAPFTVPNALLHTTLTDEGRTSGLELDNPYLYRYTDYFIHTYFQCKPMPPTGDRIGRLTARMVQLLQSMPYTPPILLTPSPKHIYEVYPKQIATALKIPHYKSDYQAVERLFHLKEPLDNAHLYDALLASFAAYMIANHHTILPLPPFIQDGWCYPIVV